MSYQVLRVVLASPTDVQAERDRVPMVIEEVNRNVAHDHGLHLELYRWETDAFPSFNMAGPQGAIDKVLEIDSCHLLIGVFWKRLGTCTADGDTGTVHEVKAAYKSWLEKRTPQMMLYFGQKASPPPQKLEETEQLSELLKFRQSLAHDGLYWLYGDEGEFEKLLRNHLIAFVRAQGKTSSQPRPEPGATASSAKPPYNFTLPASSTMFKGRKQEKSEILERISAGASYAIVGGTRIGKTSLLFELKNALLKKLDGENGYVVGPVFLSTQEFPKLSQAAIYQQIIREFEQSVWEQKFPGKPFDRGRLFDPDLKEEQAFPRFREVLKSMVKAFSSRLKVAIIIDEIDELQRYDWSRVMFQNLRHLVSASEVSEYVSIIIAGTLKIKELYKVAGSPFLNVIAGAKTLGLLAEPEALDRIDEPTGHRLPRPIAEYVLRQTGGHPFLIQYIMGNLWWNFRARFESVTEENVNEVVRLFMRERNDFAQWSEAFDEHAKAAYRFIASRGKAERYEIVDLLGSNDPMMADNAIDALLHVGVVREVRENESSTYVVGAEMFRNWLFQGVGRQKAPSLSVAKAT